ncbi:hypothetical protein LUZ60_006909 [Juncus effusus]|nr:hypothetical protein LUZ60_006909 [Juncus effusus]
MPEKSNATTASTSLRFRFRRHRSLKLGFFRSIITCGASRIRSEVVEQDNLDVGVPSEIGSDEPIDDGNEEFGSNFTVSQIRKATRNFALSRIIAQGMFSIVYDGTMKDDTTVAIKCDKKGFYNPHNSADFKSKIVTLQNTEHPNLVKFYGYSEHDDNSFFVLEYISNGNLRQHLDGLNERYLGFSERLEIAVDVANAVSYLHAHPDPIIHGKLKSSNILLNPNLQAKVSDFGFPPESGGGNEPSASVIPLVYCDPEYLLTFRFNEKSDVFSFGVVLLELFTGRAPLSGECDNDDYVTTEWVKNMFNEGRGIETLDPHLPRVKANVIVAEKALGLAVLCLNRKGHNRPTMRQCANLLSEYKEEYNELLYGYDS